MIRLNRSCRFLLAGALGMVLVTPRVAAGGEPPVPCEQLPFAPTNPEFLGIVGNELLIAVAYQANLAYLAQQYRQAGVAHARVAVNWEAIEWERGSYDWGYTDLLVSTIANAGLRTLGAIYRTPMWASSCPTNRQYYECTASDMEDYRSFVQQLVQRYGPAGTGQIHDWEIRVENLVDGAPGYTLNDYLVELNAAKDVISAADPEALVWGPEVPFGNSPVQNARAMEWVVEAKNSGDVDVLSIHHFASTPEHAFEVTTAVCNEVDCLSETGIPVAVTAMNVAGDPFGMTEEQQAENLDEMYRCVSAAGADYAMWFAGTQWNGVVEKILCDTKFGVFRYTDIYYNPNPEDPPLECNLFLNNPNKLVPRLAYDALADLGELILGQLPAGEPFGLLGAESNPCTPSNGTCIVPVRIYSTGVSEPFVQVRSNGQIVTCGQSNRHFWTNAHVTAGTSRTFELYRVPGSCINTPPTGDPLATLTVQALPN